MEPDALETLVRRLRRTPLADAQKLTPLAYGRREIERLIPHRAPFLLVDALTGVDLDARTITGLRDVDPGDPVFAGHFPGAPVYPGVLQIEAMGQLGLCLAHFVAREQHVVDDATTPVGIRATKVHHALFNEPIAPGDSLALQARVVEYDGYTGIVAGQVWRDRTLCSLSILEVYFVES